MIKNKQFIKILTMDILAKLEMLKELNKTDVKSDIPYLIGQSKENMIVIQEILEAD